MEGGNVALVGFENLDPTESKKVEKIVAGYIKKFSESSDFEEMKLTLQIHKHGKSFKNEVIGTVFAKNGRFSANATEWNIYDAVDLVCQKMLNEAAHKAKKEQRHDKKIFK